MAGMEVQVTPKRLLEFDDLEQNTTQTIVLMERVDVASFRVATLGVNLFAGTIGSTSTIKIEVVPDGHTPEDPGRIFLDMSNPLATITLDNASVASIPFYKLEGLPSNFGPRVAVTATAQRVSGDSGDLNVTVGVRMTLKDAAF